MTSLSLNHHSKKVAIVGFGGFGKKHFAAVSDLGASPVVVSRRNSVQRMLSKKDVVSFCSIDQVPDEVEFAIVATAPSDHRRGIDEALLRDWRVLVEKPLYGSCSDKLIDDVLVRSRVRVGFLLRFSEALNLVKQKIATIGEVFFVDIKCQSFLPDWRDGLDFRKTCSTVYGDGGVLLDLNHEFDYATWMFGYPSMVFCDIPVGSYLRIPVEEQANCILGYDSGLRIHIRLDYLSRAPQRGMSVFGSEGTLIWDGIANTVEILKPGGSKKYSFTDGPTDYLRKQDAAFLAGSSETAPFEAGWNCLKIVEACKKSAEKGGFVAMTDFMELAV